MPVSYDREKGFELISKVSTLSLEYGVSHNFPAAIRITKDGRFIYLSNRGEDTIAIFKADPETGLIVLQMSASTRGWYPRDFILTKDEKFLIAANQLSDNLVIYERDLRTGLLSLTDEKQTGPLKSRIRRFRAGICRVVRLPNSLQS